MFALAGLWVSVPAPPARVQTLLALFPPWWSANEVFQAASSVGFVVDMGAHGWTPVVHSETGALAQRLRNAGAWLVMDPRALRGCGPTNA
jgi:hypothetical protein